MVSRTTQDLGLDLMVAEPTLSFLGLVSSKITQYCSQEVSVGEGLVSKQESVFVRNVSCSKLFSYYKGTCCGRFLSGGLGQYHPGRNMKC